MAEFNAMGHVTLYPSNATLLTEGQMPRGVYIACSGRVKVAVGARDGKTIILKIAGNRQVLGLSAVISGEASPITVTTIELCQIKFVEHSSFLRLIESDSRVALSCARMLAQEALSSFDDVHELLLWSTARRGKGTDQCRLLAVIVSPGDAYNETLHGCKGGVQFKSFNGHRRAVEELYRIRGSSTGVLLRVSPEHPERGEIDAGAMI